MSTEALDLEGTKMIVDEELDIARERVMDMFTPESELSPKEIILKLTAEGFSEGIIRSANISLVDAGRLEITKEFNLRQTERLLAIAN